MSESFVTALGPESAALVFWRVRLSLTAADPIDLPEFAGSLVRGALGAALRQVSCTTGASTCTGCPEIAVCPYGYGFETPLPSPGDLVATGATLAVPDAGSGPFVPHPFALALDAPPKVAAGETFTLELTLVGRGRFHLASFVEAIRWLARRGLTARRSRFRLDRVDDVTPAGPRAVLLAEHPLFLAEPTDWTLDALERPVPQRLTLITRSPLRLLAKGRPVVDLDLATLLRALFRRIGALARYH